MLHFVDSNVQSITDPTGRSSFTFRMNKSEFRILQLLREREHDMREKVACEHQHHQPTRTGTW
jgi:hypothetical protein